MKVSGIVFWGGLCERRENRGALLCPWCITLLSAYCVSQTYKLEIISGYIFFFFLKLQQYLEKVALREHTFCVWTSLSVFPPLINGSVSNPPLILCNVSEIQLCPRLLQLFFGFFSMAAFLLSIPSKGKK